MAFSGKEDRYNVLVKVMFWLILATGLFLRIYQYVLNRSLWHDEAHLALNFVDLGFSGLTRPLENFQTAPILFLFSVEAVTRIAGFNEMALRFIPFLLSVIAFPLFYFFTRDITKSRVTALIAFFIYAVNLSLVYYASELKPYTIDVSVYVILGYLLFSSGAFVSKHRTILLSIVGCLSVMFSNATVIVFVCAGLYFVSQWKLYKKAGDKDHAILDMPVKHLYILGSWALVFLFNYFEFIHDHPYASGMKDIWSYTFCPTPLFGPDFNKFMQEYLPTVVMSEIFLFGDNIKYVATFLILIGIVHIIYRKNYTMLLFAALPFILHLVLSMMSLYPFYYRFLLYTAPGIMILIATGVTSIITLIQNNIYRITMSIAVSGCLIWGVRHSFEAFPRYDIRIKPALLYINEHYPHTPVLVTTPYSMYEFYYKTGLIHNGNFKTIKWNLDTDAFLNDENVKAQTTNYVVLHSVIGGDNANVFIPGLKERGLVMKEFTNNNFGVTEVKPGR